jgi:hypothetical protein
MKLRGVIITSNYRVQAGPLSLLSRGIIWCGQDKNSFTPILSHHNKKAHNTCLSKMEKDKGHIQIRNPRFLVSSRNLTIFTKFLSLLSQCMTLCNFPFVKFLVSAPDIQGQINGLPFVINSTWPQTKLFLSFVWHSFYNGQNCKRRSSHLLQESSSSIVGFTKDASNLVEHLCALKPL